MRPSCVYPSAKAEPEREGPAATFCGEAPVRAVQKKKATGRSVPPAASVCRILSNAQSSGGPGNPD
ncbi:MAG: hypothetical protein ABI972_25100, partial [Acidobacteriota bacterium]